MLPGIFLAVEGVTKALELAQGITKLTNRAELQKVMADLTERLLDTQAKTAAARAEYEELAKVKDKLEKKLIRYKRWDAQAARYQLSELVPGVVVYTLKPDQAGAEPMHSLCPNCFEKRKRSILQTPSPGSTKRVCHQCEFGVSIEATSFEMIKRTRGPLL